VSASLTVVGVGIQVPAHVTAEGRASLEQADEVLFLVAEPVAEGWIESVNPRSRSLAPFFEPGRDRSEGYAAIVDEILVRLRHGRDVCLALYGHPGVYATPSHEAIRRARAEGFAARMLPAVSAEDCLFADLGVDPGDAGCQSYEATDLVRHRRRIDSSASLILWQTAIFGNRLYTPAGDASRLPRLVEYLVRYYPPDHEVTCYAASPYPVVKPIVERFPLAMLASAPIPRLSLLFIPPATRRADDPALEREAQACTPEASLSDN
jgi:uncharacterized protein YabN with tetrapyrrole methylase and pyrophosphatase domain